MDRYTIHRVVVYIIGPIAPLSETGHRYILTISSGGSTQEEAVAEVLQPYSGVGIPEEMLTGQGTHFPSDCMQEVSRLLSIKSLSSRPYHLICNELVERWNGN